VSSNAASGHDEHAQAGTGAVRPISLCVYVESGCSTCEHAIELMERVRAEYPKVSVQIIDVGVSSDELPEGVFAVPTVLLDDRVISLGTPSWERLVREIEARGATSERASTRE
jgi:alkyl hydroperoxide reductase subunit AhpF